MELCSGNIRFSIKIRRLELKRNLTTLTNKFLYYTMEKCKLCKEEKKLQQSHIIPKFVYKWMRKTGSKYFRSYSNPNKRLQDGFTEELLCKECEQLFSTYEEWFAEKVFYPYLNLNHNIISYKNEMPKFIISILWRILILDENKRANPIFNKVLNEWRDYLLNNITPNEFDKIYLMFIPDKWGLDSQPHQYISRYFNRVSDGGIIQIEGQTIIYSKIARFFLFAEIEKSGVNFRGSDIYFNSGVTMGGQYIINEQISNYFISRSYQVFKFMEENASPKQKEVIYSEVKKTFEELLEKDLGKQLLSDMSAKIEPYEHNHTFPYICDCCNKELYEPEGFLLRTFEVVQSEKYWKFVFKMYNDGIDEIGLKNRLERFKSLTSIESPWVICDNCMRDFFVEKAENKVFMKEWIAKKGDYQPPKNGYFREYLSEEEFKKVSLTIVTVE